MQLGLKERKKARLSATWQTPATLRGRGGAVTLARSPVAAPGGEGRGRHGEWEGEGEATDRMIAGDLPTELDTGEGGAGFDDALCGRGMRDDAEDGPSIMVCAQTAVRREGGYMSDREEA